MTKRPRQHLIIDADDTLWENNIFFEQAVEEFIDYLNLSHLTRAEVRAVLDEIESANASTHGYGSRAFTANLRACFKHLNEGPFANETIQQVMRFGLRILEQDVQLLAGVAETLPVLAMRHDLVIFTKGHPEEQQMKIERSGIDQHFFHIAIVPEKDERAYHDLSTSLGVDKSNTWMIGNSPKSDINAALAAGLNAVFIPHQHTWTLEQAEIASGPGKLLQLKRFTDLLKHF